MSNMKNIFLTYSKEAQNNNLGLWALSKEITSEFTNAATLTDSSTFTQNVYVDPDGKGLIKGNINSKGEKIYHMPGGLYYEQTIPEIWFKTEQEAQSAGFRKSKKINKYEKKLVISFFLYNFWILPLV